jgi:hypothetical protein
MNAYLRIIDQKELFNMGWNAHSLLDYLINLDFEVIEGLVDNAEGNVSQWAPIFENAPYSYRLLVDENNLIVGYWHFVIPTEDIIKKCRLGLLNESKLSPADIIDINNPGLYDIYIVSICLLPKYQMTGASTMLIASLREVIRQLAKDGVIVRHIFGNAYSTKGQKFSKKIGLKKITNHIEHGIVVMGNTKGIDKYLEKRQQIYHKSNI